MVEESSAMGTELEGLGRGFASTESRGLSALGLDRARALGIPKRNAAKSGLRFYALESARADFDPLAAAAALRATGRFRAVCPDYRLELARTTPSDPQFGRQWYLDDTGVSDLRIAAAWDTTRGSSDVVIAIIDSGVDLGHPDLASKIWRNPGETANGIDDDGNGLVDDVQGWDFTGGDSDPSPQPTIDADGYDAGFHGTFCAGIAGAATDDGYGIAGAGWQCRIMPLKVIDANNHLTASTVASAFIYATDMGASVISLSFGGPPDRGVAEFYQALVDLATDGGVVCVAAAGNDNDDLPFYPAACNDVLSVAATTFSGTRASFSNYGSWVKVAAPGTGMWSTLARNYRYAARDSTLFTNFLGWDGSDPHMYDDGTSYACPLVAAVCGLTIARFPALAPRQVIQHVIATGDVVAFDRPIGVRVNALTAVSTIPTAPPNWPFRLAAPRPNPAPGAFTARFSLTTDGDVQLAVFDVAGRRVRALAQGFYALGLHDVRWDGTDDEGHQVANGIYFVRLESGGQALNRRVVLLRR